MSSTRRGCFTARVRRVRRRIDDVSIVQRCVSNLSRGTGGLARSVGEARMYWARGRNSTFSGVADAGSTQLWLVERMGNQGGAAFRNSQINSDRGDPPFLIWRGTDTSDSRGYGSSFLPLDLDQRFTSPVPTESPTRRDFSRRRANQSGVFSMNNRSNWRVKSSGVCFQGEVRRAGGHNRTRHQLHTPYQPHTKWPACPSP